MGPCDGARANLVLVEARTASFSDLFNAVNFARSLNGVVAVSMSWGAGEFSGQNAYDSMFTTPAGHLGGNGQPGGITFVAASGDTGAWSGVSYPASSPNVLSVGATTLNLGAGGATPASQRGLTAPAGSAFSSRPRPIRSAHRSLRACRTACERFPTLPQSEIPRPGSLCTTRSLMAVIPGGSPWAGPVPRHLSGPA